MLSEASILELTYFDKCDVYRYMQIEDTESGITRNKELLLYSNVRCAISKNTDALLNETDGYNSINTNHKLFCNPSYLLQSGDIVKVTFENGLKSTYKCGEPFYYSSHINCPIEKENLV